MEWVKGDSAHRDKPVFYSLGNFVSNQRRSGTDGGAIVRIEMESKGDRLCISRAGYYLTWVYAPIINYRKKFYILPCSEFENHSEFFTNTADHQKMIVYIKNARRYLNRQNTNVNEIPFAGNDMFH
jgi:poly-gamma-glutamate synthesis protein (capsule biosynthesis protein)